MRYLWLAIIVVTAAPLLLVAWLANPILFVLVGADIWRERVLRLAPYRWWILFLIAVCAFSVAIYSAAYR